jgi:hypothetical protein
VAAGGGIGTYTYQWYSGNIGNTADPVATESSCTVSPTGTTSYWVQVGDADDDTVTSSIIVNPDLSATAAGITANPSEIYQGGPPPPRRGQPRIRWTDSER